LNYLLAGKPVISFAGGAKGVRHMHDAFVVPNHDLEALGLGIVTLLNDRALAEKLGANGNATVRAEFDWRQICRKIEGIYDKLLATPQSACGQTELAASAVPKR
jgi:glycosyltransferase involved in cell wall biosynthesis